MWPLFYLSLFNLGLGFSVAFALYLRQRYVRKQLARGYDLRRLSPPSRLRNLCRRVVGFVNVERVCRQLGEPVPTVKSGAGSAVTLDETESQKTTTEQAALNANETEAVALESASAADVSPSELPDLQSPTAKDQTARELGPLEHTPREVRYLEPLAAKYGGEEPAALAEKRSSAKQVATLDPLSPVGSAKLAEPNSNDASKSANKKLAQEERQKFSAPTATAGDLLQRVSAIDRMLRAVLDEEAADPAATLGEVITHVQQTHQWWTDFEGLVPKALKKNSSTLAQREQMAQVDDDLIAIQASLVECKNLIESVTKTATGTEPRSAADLAQVSPKFPRDMHNSIIQATKSGHRLRDHLALLTPDSPLRFVPTEAMNGSDRPPLAYEATFGIQGLETVASQWEAEICGGTSKIASLVLVDLDRTSHWNNELGLESVDRILETCHRQLAESVRSNRGFDRVIRICGQQFLVFLGSTPATQAKFAADRLRQVFANTTWRAAGQALVIQLSAAVAAYDPGQSIVAQIAKLRSGLPEAKRLGGNTVVEEIQPGRFQKIAGVPKYPLPARHHDQPLEKWNPRASVTC